MQWVEHAYEHVLPARLVRRGAQDAMIGLRGGYRP